MTEGIQELRLADESGQCRLWAQYFFAMAGKGMLGGEAVVRPCGNQHVNEVYD